MTNKEMPEPTKEELEAADKVINTDRVERGQETLAEALVNRVEETIEIGDTGYPREVVLPIPLELIQTNDDAKHFLKLVGQISRDKSYNLPIEIEEESVEKVKLMNLVLKPTKETDLKALKRKLL